MFFSKGQTKPSFSNCDAAAGAWLALSRGRRSLFNFNVRAFTLLSCFSRALAQLVRHVKILKFPVDR